MLYDWMLLYQLHVNISYIYLISYFEELLDLYAPYKVKIIRPAKKKLVPWMIKALVESSRKWRNLYIKSTKI